MRQGRILCFLQNAGSEIGSNWYNLKRRTLEEANHVGGQLNCFGWACLSRINALHYDASPHRSFASSSLIPPLRVVVKKTPLLVTLCLDSALGRYISP